MGKLQSKLKPEMVAELKEMTQFSEKELQESYRRFLKNCPDGMLTVDRFKKLYGKVSTDGDASIFAEQVFRTFDSNGDGKVDFREMICALYIITHQSVESAQKLRWAFSMYDIDGNGYIEREEVLEIMRAFYKMMGSDIIRAEEEETPEKKAEDIFRQLDGNMDGKISLSEFIEGVKSDHTIVKLLCT
jgi:Ca2+-binding EF-hand superfamily protein